MSTVATASACLAEFTKSDGEHDFSKEVQILRHRDGVLQCILGSGDASADQTALAAYKQQAATASVGPAGACDQSEKTEDAIAKVLQVCGVTFVSVFCSEVARRCYYDTPSKPAFEPPI